MIRKVAKGEIGYIKNRKLVTMTAMIFGYLLVLLVLFTGLTIYADKRNLFTMGAILLCLPAAKMTVNFLMLPRHGRAELKEYEELCEISKGLPVLCDLVITPEKKVVEIAYAFIAPGHIIAFSSDNKLDNNYHSDFIKTFMKASDINTDVSLYSDYLKFVKRIRSILASHPERYSEKEINDVENTAYNLKIMSL